MAAGTALAIAYVVCLILESTPLYPAYLLFYSLTSLMLLLKTLLFSLLPTSGYPHKPLHIYVLSSFIGSTPWKRLTTYEVPANMPACPEGGCICAVSSSPFLATSFRLLLFSGVGYVTINIMVMM